MKCQGCARAFVQRGDWCGHLIFEACKHNTSSRYCTAWFCATVVARTVGLGLSGSGRFQEKILRSHRFRCSSQIHLPLSLGKFRSRGCHASTPSATAPPTRRDGPTICHLGPGFHHPSHWQKEQHSGGTVTVLTGARAGGPYVKGQHTLLRLPSPHDADADSNILDVSLQKKPA